jgi:ATP synthase F1 complex assembly factor 1
LSPSSSTAGSGSSSAQPRLPQLPRSQAGPKPLSAYVDVPKLLELPARELEYVWRLRHASSPDSLCAVIPAATYARMAARARRHPQFILPLPRRTTRISSPPTPPPSPSDPAAAADAAGVSAAVDAASADEGIGAGVDGAEIHFLQWSFPTPTTSVVLFTHLAEYKLRGAFSQPHTTVTHHLDLLAPRGVVLLHGSVARGRGVGVDDGRWLLMCLQKFYGGVGGVGGNNGADALGSGGGDGNEASTSLPHDRLLEQFTSGAADFRLEELLDHAERIT